MVIAVASGRLSLVEIAEVLARWHWSTDQERELAVAMVLAYDLEISILED